MLTAVYACTVHGRVKCRRGLGVLCSNLSEWLRRGLCPRWHDPAPYGQDPVAYGDMISTRQHTSMRAVHCRVK